MHCSQSAYRYVLYAQQVFSMNFSMSPYLWLCLCTPIVSSIYCSACTTVSGCFWEQRVQNPVFAPSCIILQHPVSSCNGILEIKDEVWGEPCGNCRVAMVNLCSIPFETVQNSKSCKTIQSTQIQKLAKHIETHRKIRKKILFLCKIWRPTLTPTHSASWLCDSGPRPPTPWHMALWPHPKTCHKEGAIFIRRFGLHSSSTNPLQSLV